MQIVPKTTQEAMDIVYNILNQGDGRYNAPENELILSEFIINEAISLEEKEIPEIQEPDKEYLRALYEVQVYAKYVAKVLLINTGFKESEIIFERRFLGSRPDVFAESNTRIILVECYSCRVDKIIDYLSNPKIKEVWVITRGETPWEKIPYLGEKMKLFIFKRGINWQKSYEELKRQEYERIKKVKNPLDRIKGI